MLKEEKFQTLDKNSKALSQKETAKYLQQLEGWQIKKVDGVDQLVKGYSFENFLQSLDFTNKVGQLAEEFNHHPLLKTEWGKTEVRWWTHSVGGLHLNDFIMALKTDEL